MTDFPTLSDGPVVPIKETTVRETIREKYENGLVNTRSRWTTSRKRFHVRYEYMNANDFGSLDNFFANTAKAGAVSFDWEHPQTGSTHTVRFSKDELDWETTTAINLRNCEFDIEEV
jgi:hypothetical protein